MRESDLLAHIFARSADLASVFPGVVVGPGDDCAVVRCAEGGVELLKTDVVVENVHFLRSAEPQLIGRKALARAISDMAAMGGVPRHALVTVVLPADLSVSYVLKIYDGLLGVAAEFGVSVVGGETAKGEQMVISVALTGVAPHGAVLRSGACVGDVLWVTGLLGGSSRGHHFNFTPRVREAAWLMQHARPRAMMDLSDGLARDLPRLASASGVGWQVSDEKLPLSDGCTAAQAWNDGEDYELLFTTSASVATGLQAAWQAAFPQTALTQIGVITEAQSSGDALGGWDHFGKEGAE